MSIWTNGDSLLTTIIKGNIESEHGLGLGLDKSNFHLKIHFFCRCSRPRYFRRTCGDVVSATPPIAAGRRLHHTARCDWVPSSPPSHRLHPRCPSRLHPVAAVRRYLSPPPVAARHRRPPRLFLVAAVFGTSSSTFYSGRRTPEDLLCSSGGAKISSSAPCSAHPSAPAPSVHPLNLPIADSIWASPSAAVVISPTLWSSADSSR